jgi:hypothetical protein
MLTASAVIIGSDIQAMPTFVMMRHGKTMNKAVDPSPKTLAVSPPADHFQAQTSERRILVLQHCISDWVKEL